MTDLGTSIRTVPPPPARTGMALSEIETPALIVDIDAMEHNLRDMAGRTNRAGLRLRPHAKTHKCVEIARRQIALGAVGVCCQKVSEAEVLVRGGIGDVLVANEIVGKTKLERLARLAREARIGLCIDSIEGVAEAEAAAAGADVTLDILVEVEVGGERCGAPAGGPAAILAEAVAGAPHLCLRGIQAFNGKAQHIVDHHARRVAAQQVATAVRATVEALAARGLHCEIVSGGGTGTIDFDIDSEAMTETQAGSYVFMDADYGRIEGGSDDRFSFRQALFVMATVMSRPNDHRAVVDAGHKAASVDAGLPVPHRLPGVSYHRPSDEHGVLIGDSRPVPARGDRVLLVPGHCDPTVNLHDWIVAIRDLQGANAHVEAVWPVDARGALF